MGKIEINKTNKRNSLLQNAYDLFVEQGFAKTTIADVTKRAGLAKGTFYLYFNDKYDLRDQLVTKKSAEVLNEAHSAIQKKGVSGGFEEQILATVDYVIRYLSRNRRVLRFISKNLSWGLFRHAVKSDVMGADLGRFYEAYLSAMERDGITCEEPELLLFTIIELVGATCYSCILYESPAPMKNYLPYLHESIRALIQTHTKIGKISH